MNLRRGSFRLWVVFALLWVGGALVLVLSKDDVEASAYYSPFDDAFHFPPPPAEWNFGCDEAGTNADVCRQMARFIDKGISHSEKTPSGVMMIFWTSKPPLEAAIYPVNAEEKQYIVADLGEASSATKARLAELASKADSLYSARVHSSRLEAAKSFVIGGLVPPLVVLAAGYVFAWVIGGFRQSR
jgi:hypothetical protein